MKPKNKNYRWIYRLIGVACVVGSGCVSETEVTTRTEPEVTTHTELDRREVQVNSYTDSTQSAPALADHPDGGFTVAWHSRRQQQGTYGIYLQRFSSTGAAVGAERQGNIFTQSMQMNPAIATDDMGATWLAWESFGQDGSFNAIIARRFDGDDLLGGDEFLVNQYTTGNQSDVVVTTSGAGIATFFWASQSPDGERKQVVGRSFGPDGIPLSDEFVVANTEQHQNLPSCAALADQLVVVWAEQDSYGRPAGIFGRLLDPYGQPLSDRFALSERDGQPHIEPNVCANLDGFVVSWLRGDGDGEEYEVLVRGFAGNSQPLYPAIRVSKLGSRYISGAAVATNEIGRSVVMWNQQTDQFGRDINIVAQILDRDGIRIGPVFDVNRQSPGRHRLAAASGKNRVTWSSAQMRAVWFGANGNDESSVNVTALVESGSEFDFVRPQTTTENIGVTVAEQARPHEPPTYDPKLIAAEPFGGFNPLGPVGDDFGFIAINATGWTPPDPCLAAGPSHLVAMTNGAIAFFNKTGTLTFSDQIEGASGFWGSLGATGLVFDPEVLFDPHSQRFFAMACERSGNSSFFLLAVSDDSNPNGNWFRYRLNVTGLAGSNIDSPNLAVDDEVVYLAADFFSPDRFLVYMLRKSDLLTGGPVDDTSLIVNGSHSYGLPLMYDADSPAFYMIQAFEFGNFSTVRMHAITNPLGTPQRTDVTVNVPTYGHPQDPPQQGTSNRPELFEARFWSCVYRNGSLWAVHHQSPNSTGTVRARWYEFAMNGWPLSGQSPVLVQSGELTPLNGQGQLSATFFPSIWVDEFGNAAITTARSSNSEFISMSRAIRAADDPAGTFQDLVLVRPSTAPYTSAGRWGDYSGTNSDPNQPGTFWGIHEFVDSSSIWQTYIAQYVLPGSTTILPTSFHVSHGTLVKGVVESLHDSDDQGLQILSAAVDKQNPQPVLLELGGNSVNTEFSQLVVLVESRANTPGVTQRVELFNFFTQEFELVDSRPIGIQDEAVTLKIGGDLSRFITPGSGSLVARLAYEISGPTLLFPWKCTIDQFVWQIGD